MKEVNKMKCKHPNIQIKADDNFGIKYHWYCVNCGKPSLDNNEIGRAFNEIVIDDSPPKDGVRANKDIS